MLGLPDTDRRARGGGARNCGLEDVRILDVLLRKAGVKPTAFLDDDMSEDTQLTSALQCYTESRHKDLVAISDLAMAN